MEFWEWVIALGTLAATGATAWYMRLSWLSQKRRDATENPTVSVDPSYRRDQREPTILWYSVDEQFRTAWRVESISVKWPFWSRSLALAAGRQDEYGGTVRSPILPYRRSVSPDDSDAVFVAPGSEPLRLAFRLTLRSDTSVSSKMDVFISMRA